MLTPYPTPNEAQLLAQAREYAAQVVAVDAMIGDLHETIQHLDRAGTPDEIVAPLRRLAREGSHLITGGATTAQLAEYAARCKAATRELERTLSPDSAESEER